MSELCLWNTEGLNPGSYNLRITMSDNTVDHNKVEAIKTINLSQGSKKQDLSMSTISVFPNPVSSDSDIQINPGKIIFKSASIFDANGKALTKKVFNAFEKRYTISSQGLKPGSYILLLTDENDISIYFPLVIVK